MSTSPETIHAELKPFMNNMQRSLIKLTNGSIDHIDHLSAGCMHLVLGFAALDILATSLGKDVPVSARMSDALKLAVTKMPPLRSLCFTDTIVTVTSAYKRTHHEAEYIMGALAAIGLDVELDVAHQVANDVRKYYEDIVLRMADHVRADREANPV